jgi:CRISPR/Cas system-associated exonuclease Cas4 (RecB family)
VTSISLFQQCPRKYYLSRYLRWQPQRERLGVEEETEYPERDSGELQASELGTQVHAILAGQLVPDPDPEAVDLADRFRTSALGKRAEKALRKGHETDFVMAVEDLVLRGQIDLWFEDSRGLILVDYKTDRVKTPVPRDRIEAYELQLQIYAIALDRMFGRFPDRAYLHFLRPDVAVEVDLSPLQVNGARQVVRDFLDAQDRMDFPVRPGDHCYSCPHYRQMCTAEVEELVYAHRR